MTSMPRAILLTVAGTAALAGLAGCSFTGGNPTQAAPAPTATAKSWMATPAKPAPPTSKAPPLTNTGAAWPTVLGSMITYGQWLLANPNPALAATITEPGCASNTALTGQLQSLVEQNAYIQPSPPALTSIIGPYASSAPAGTSAAAAQLGGQVIIDVQAVRPAEQVIDRSQPANGQTRTSKTITLDDHAAMAPTALKITLNRGSDNKWRFCSIADPINTPDADAITTLF